MQIHIVLQQKNYADCIFHTTLEFAIKAFSLSREYRLALPPAVPLEAHMRHIATENIPDSDSTRIDDHLICQGLEIP
jgi:hypothetical protein